ncbi:hypothetical protein CPter91_4241 [Collimonas pratensis]|uniref:Uncharacterized protein n=1 Tax=Collimonas pratensis TaxID=279113 RepID=A0A127Q980_9BURK|nr:hypothetical protein CPter91_4241 [Collimonas pratensis]
MNAPDIGLDNNCRITVLLENAGQTPTKNLRMNIHWDVFDEKLPQDFAFPESHLPPAAAHIGPGGTVHSRHVDIPNPILSLVARRLRFVYVWGWVDYDDVIDPTTRHRTEYCFEMLMDGDLSSYAMHEQFNAADEDCLRKPASFYD